ncbi:NAD(P)/FAD-dependent oxidoreductase [Oerskovia flava]|uniref:NAD(P)/FAD-dependent oxidoreductase n=1 Tax=Oerskovia flava TaxID=2986422 RepID=UPI002240401F|nr:NAD(P)/FAD-dependent oxidoreductase [Oerskovia sp. JB1-3-2]
MPTTRTYDAVVLGGGAAGLSAAVTLARSLRSVVVIDAGEPRNAPAAGAHNLLGREGVAPLELLATGRREAESYGAEIRSGRATSARRAGEEFEVEIDGAGGEVSTVRARRLLLATGLVDELPDVPGVRELWGRDVLHCPYCHGWEARGRRIAVLGSGAMSVHQTLLFRQLSDDVTLYLHTAPEPDDATWEQLAALGVRVVEGTVARLDVEDGALRGVVLEDGSAFPAGAVVVGPRMVARGELFEQLGGTLEDHPMGRFVPVGPRGETTVPGVWAAGNTSDLSAMVGAAAAAGVMAGAGINAELVQEDAQRAAERRRAPFSARA